jgi:hypothetical protein
VDSAKERAITRLTIDHRDPAALQTWADAQLQALRRFRSRVIASRENLNDLARDMLAHELENNVEPRPAP